MGQGVCGLRLVVDRNRKPAGAPIGQPIECKCGSRTTVEVRIDRRIKAGKVTPGQKQLRCFDCKAVVY